MTTTSPAGVPNFATPQGARSHSAYDACDAYDLFANQRDRVIKVAITPLLGEWMKLDKLVIGIDFSTSSVEAAGGPRISWPRVRSSYWCT